MIKTLILHPALTPYRIDLFNRLSTLLDLTVIFIRNNVSYYRYYDQYTLRKSLHCHYGFHLSGINIMGKEIRTGLFKSVLSKRPNVIVSHEFSWVTLYLQRHKKKLSSAGISHLLWSTENEHMLKSRGPVRRYIRKVCSRSADGLLLYTESARKGFIGLGVDPEKIFLCSNLQDPTVFKAKVEAAHETAQNYLREYNLESKKIILYVGRLCTEKNLHSLIETFSLKTAENPQIVLVIVGKGPLEASLKKSVFKLGINDKVIFTGHRQGDELYSWYKLAGVLVLPSKWEPYGAVVNEALIAGIPVLCSRSAGASELIEDSKNGRVFDPEDKLQMEKYLIEMIEASSTADELTGQLRPDLMFVPFERDVISFVEAVNHAISERKS